MKREIPFSLADEARRQNPLIHCITNYVSVQDVANGILSCGGSPIMSDHPAEVEAIASLADALLLNLGTLQENTVAVMLRAGRRAKERQLPILLDPVGAGSSGHRTDASLKLVEALQPSVIRGNASEIKALLQAKKGGSHLSSSRGVDAAPCDQVTAASLPALAQAAQELSRLAGAVVVMTGAVDIACSPDEIWYIKNGCSRMSGITGSGCMLDGLIACYAAAARHSAAPAGTLPPQAHSTDPAGSLLPRYLEAAALATALSGLCGERADTATRERMAGLGTFHMLFLDQISMSDSTFLEGGANIEIQ